MDPLTSTDTGADIDAGDEVVGRSDPLARATCGEAVAGSRGAEVVP